MSPPSFDPGFSTDALSAVYTPRSTVAAILEFEASLALALAEVGIAPVEEAEELAAVCRVGVSDPEEVLSSTWEEGTPIIALRQRIAAEVSERAGQWFHRGATTQDAIDTAQMLQARTALGVIGQSLDSIARQLRHLTVTHRDTAQMGRTFLQDGRPTTFGFRTATWLDSTLGHILELRRQRDGLTLQLGGPVGTNAEYGASASGVVSALAERLALRAPDISWHSNRDKVLALAQAGERMAATMGKIGTDLAILASTSISEVSVRSGGSSSMPGKKNPIDAIRAVAAASACHGAVAMLSFAPPHQLDRAVGSWHVEWIALPLTLQTAGAAAEAIDDGLASIEVDPEAMTGRVTSDPTVDDGRIDTVLENFERVVGS